MITTSFTFVASTETIIADRHNAGIRGHRSSPHNIDPAKIEAAITPRTKAIMPIHLFGQICDIDGVLEIIAVTT